MTAEQVLTTLTAGTLNQGRPYGPNFARAMLVRAKIHGWALDVFPADADGCAGAVQIKTLNDAGTEFSVREVTVTPLGG